MRSLLRLERLLGLTRGDPRVKIAVLDGPLGSPHRQMVTSALLGPTGAGLLALSPGCTVESWPVLDESPRRSTADGLADALRSAASAGPCIINLSVAVRPRGCVARLTAALDLCARRGAIVVAAAGNEAIVGTSVVTSHPAVLPVVGCDLAGRVVELSNLAPSFGRRGVMAPARGYCVSDGRGMLVAGHGTSMSAPIVSAAIALLASHFPHATLDQIRSSVIDPTNGGLIPPLLDVERSIELLSATKRNRR